MATNTPNYNLIKPAHTDTLGDSLDDFNSNADTIDSTMAQLQTDLTSLSNKLTPQNITGVSLFNTSVQQNLEATLRKVGGLCVGFVIFAYKSTYTGGDGMQKAIIGMPKTGATLQMPIICVAGTNSGRTGRVRVVNDGNTAYIQFFYSGSLQGVAGETYLIPVCYPLATS